MRGQDPFYVDRNLRLDPGEISVSFIHASGPGGQKVNKVATAAQLRFSVRDSASLPDEIKSRLYEIAGKRINRQGELVITARRHRTQARNREDALSRLRTLILRAARRPAPRISTRPGPAARKRRLDEKTRRGRVKASRRRPQPED